MVPRLKPTDPDGENNERKKLTRKVRIPDITGDRKGPGGPERILARITYAQDAKIGTVTYHLTVAELI